jgi:16S rRNA (cytosine967-C5)-methyltransferase
MQEQPRKILGKPAIKPARTVAAAPEAQPPAPLLELKPDSLAFSLSGAAQAVAYVLEGMALPQALAKVFHKPMHCRRRVVRYRIFLTGRCVRSDA